MKKNDNTFAMDSQICKSCGSPIKYLEGTNHTVCTFCGLQVTLNQTLYAKDKTEAIKSSISYFDDDITLVNCEACGFEVYIHKNQGNFICPACASEQSHKRLDNYHSKYKPQAIIPLQFDETQGIRLFEKWAKDFKFLKKIRIEKVHITSCYLPYWNTNINDELSLNGYEHSHIIRKSIPVKASNHLICSVTTNQYLFSDINDAFDLDLALSYDHGYMAGHNYRHFNFSYNEALSSIISAIKLDKSETINQLFKGKKVNKIDGYMNGAGVELYAIYLPFYIVEYIVKNVRYTAFINGQTGMVSGSRPKTLMDQFSLFTNIYGAQNILLMIFLALLAIGVIIAGIYGVIIFYGYFVTYPEDAPYGIFGLISLLSAAFIFGKLNIGNRGRYPGDRAVNKHNKEKKYDH